MGNYFFLASLIPPIEIGHIPSISYQDYRELLRENLSKDDLRKVEILLRLFDLENMRALWANEPLDNFGNYNKEQLIQAISELQWPSGEPFEPLLAHFLTDYSDDKDRLKHFPMLISLFLKKRATEEKGFLHKYFEFERELRLVVAGFRAKIFHKDLSAELQYEDPQEVVVAQLLAQKDASSFEPPFEFEELKPYFEAYRAFPLELHKVLNQYKFQKVEIFNENKLFSIDRLLGYLVQLIIVEKWLELDTGKGNKIVDAIVKDTK